MSISDAIAAYDNSIFGPEVIPEYRGDYSSYGRSHDVCYICCDCSGGGVSSGGNGDESAKAVLVLAAAAAAFSTIVFAGFSANSYNSAIKLGKGKREANHTNHTNHTDQKVVGDIKAVFRGLQAERAFTGTAHLFFAAASAMLMAACVLGALKRGPYVNLCIGGGITGLGGGILFCSRYGADPSDAVYRLKSSCTASKPSAGSNLHTSILPSAPPPPPPADDPPTYQEATAKS